MSEKEKIRNNFFSLTIAQILNKIAPLIVFPYLTRVLGPDYFGKLSFAEALVSYFLLIVQFGFNTYGVREVAKKQDRPFKVVSNIFSIKLLLAIVSYILLVIFTLYINKSLEIKLLLLLFGLNLFPMALFLDWVFQGIEEMKYIAISNLISVVVLIILTFSLIRDKSDFYYRPIIVFVQTLLAAIFLIILYNKKFDLKLKFTFNKIIWYKIFQGSVLLAISSVLIKIYYNMDTIMLGFMSDDEIVGYYNGAYKLIYAILPFIALLSSVLLPNVTKFFNNNEIDKALTILKKSMKYLILLSLPITVGGVLVSNKLVPFILGEQYQASVNVFRVLLLAILGIAIANVYVRQILIPSNKNKIYLAITGIGALINLILNFILIPKYNMIGAAIATAITEWSITFMAYYFSNKIVKVEFLLPLLKTTPSILLMAISIFCLNKLNINVLIEIFIAGTIYIFGLIITKVITVKEIRRIIV